MSTDYAAESMNWNTISPNKVLIYASCDTILSSDQAFQFAKKPAAVKTAARGTPYWCTNEK
jgi:hypothetical protein